MKINRVMMCTDNNKNYTGYWNTVSAIWKEIFNIEPTLIFIGSEQEMKANNFIYQDKIIRLDRQPYNTWHVTWSPFWATQFFKDDICMTVGIDQIPLSEYFFNFIETLEEHKYVIGISDCYKNYTKDTLGYFNTATNGFYPSSHHVGKGETFEKIYNFSKTWPDEIQKLYSSSNKYYFRDENLWGLDECYSSEKISLSDQDNIEFLQLRSWFLDRRIYLGLTDYNLDLIGAGHYSEVTYKPCTKSPEKINEIILALKRSIK